MPGAAGASPAGPASASGRPSTASISRARQPAGAEQHRRLAGKPDDGRFQADRRRPGVEDDADMVAEVVDDMGGGGRADMAGAVGARRRQRPGAGGQQRLRHRMRRHAHGQRVEAGRDQIGDAGIGASAAAPGSAAPARRPRPAARHRAPKRDVARGLGRRGDMDDQRVEARPSLGEEDAADRGRIGGVGGKPVDRLGRHRHQFAPVERCHRRGDALRRLRPCMSKMLGGFALACAIGESVGRPGEPGSRAQQQAASSGSRRSIHERARHPSPKSLFALKAYGGLDRLIASGAFPDLDGETAEAIIEEG